MKLSKFHFHYFLPPILLAIVVNPLITHANNEATVLVNDNQIDFQNMKLINEQNHYLVPLRELQEKMNINIFWDNENKDVMITKIFTKEKDNTQEKDTIDAQLETGYVFSNFSDLSNNRTEVTKLSPPVKILHNTVYIPIRFLGESLGYTVDWNEEQKDIHLWENPNIESISKVSQYQVFGDYKRVQPNELELFFLTNEEREKTGVSPLAYDIKDGEIARLKSKDMYDNGYFAHYSPTYGTPFEMLKKFGVTYKYAGENLAAGYKTPQEAILGLMNSQSHRANVLREVFTRVGIGYYEGPNGYQHYFTQLFTD